MKITTVGIDLAKALFQVHGVDERSKAVLRKQLKRKDFMSYFANLEACLIGMEACASAHYWARKLSELGHSVRLTARPTAVSRHLSLVTEFGGAPGRMKLDTGTRLFRSESVRRRAPKERPG